MNEPAIIPPEILLSAYSQGIFPMSDSAEDNDFYWVTPKKRGILPLSSFHIPQRLKRILRKEPFEIRFDTAFSHVIECCAETYNDRQETWINPIIRNSYIHLHQLGYAHSVEVYKDDQLVAGLYGVRLGRAFFGESMFHRIQDTSKIALTYLVAHLLQGGFLLLDTQFITDHLQQFGAIEIPQKQYLNLLDDALHDEAQWINLGTKYQGINIVSTISEFQEKHTLLHEYTKKWKNIFKV